MFTNVHSDQGLFAGALRIDSEIEPMPWLHRRRPVGQRIQNVRFGWEAVNYLFGLSLLRHQQRIVVRHQLPLMLPLYPYSREAIVTGNCFASVLPNHG